MQSYAQFIYGYDKKVATRYGNKRYINLDNAASTPPFLAVIKRINHCAEWYSSIHRGAGYKSKYSTEQYEAARIEIGRFVETDLQEDVVIFTKNTTDSINKLHHYLQYLPGEFVIYTKIEHHSNELPWQNYKNHCICLKNGVLDLQELENFLKKHSGKVKLVAVNGASNVTGYLPPIYTIAEMAHNYGAKILVDGAQLVPHRPIKKYQSDNAQHLDFLVFSGHKMYAPFGSGVLIGAKKLFAKGRPSQVGGGTVKGIGPQGIIWSSPPENEEAGSPNVLGALAIAESCKTIAQIGWTNLIHHEEQLISYAFDQLKRIPEIIIYNSHLRDQVGVISFNLKNFYHQDIADYLSHEHGIGVRSGCFCTRSYVLELLGMNIENIKNSQIYHSEKPPGMVRMSFGCYNNTHDIDYLVAGLTELLEKKTLIGSH